MPDSSPKLNDFKVNILGSKGMFNLDLTHNQLIERYLSKRKRPAGCDWAIRFSEAAMEALCMKVSSILSIAWLMEKSRR